MDSINKHTTNLILLVSLLWGCAGPQPAVTSRGIIGVGATAGPPKVFENAHAASFAAPTEAPKAKLMMETGMNLIRANCMDFFSSAGDRQRWLIVTKDTVGAVGTLATGIMALHNTGRNAVANVGFATGAIFTGLDIYTKNFLFSAENIDSVRSLVKSAYAVHAAAVETSPPATYGDAIELLIDHQNICAPMHVMALARDAIKDAKLVASTPSDTEGPLRQKIRQAIGLVLNPPGAVSEEQSAYLWWLLKDSPTPDELTNVVLPALSGLAKIALITPGAATYDQIVVYNIQGLFDGFGSGMQDSFRRFVIAKKAERAQQLAAAAAVKRAAAPPADGVPITIPTVVPVAPFSSFASSNIRTNRNIKIEVAK